MEDIFYIVKVDEEEIEEMFNTADKDGDGKLSYSEFLTMINPHTTNNKYQE